MFIFRLGLVETVPQALIMSILAPKPIRLLLISDVHFGKLAATPEFALSGHNALHPIQGAVSMKKHLIQTVKGIIPIPQALLVLGDLTSIASPSEFRGSVHAVIEIAGGVGINEENVIFTFGNHDVDWRICSLATPTGQFPKDEFYNTIAAHAGNFFAENPPTFENGLLPGSGVFVNDDFELFVLNSGHFCVSDQDYRHGKLGEDQLKWLDFVLQRDTPLPKWRILMVHHHPFNYPYPTLAKDISTLEEGAELVELAGRRGIDFVCHGHRHHPKISTQMAATWKGPVTYFCAGSLGVNETERNNGQIPNLFHVVSLESRLSNGAAFGSVQTFEYAASEGWRQIRNTKETPLDHIQYFGVIATASELSAFAKNFLLPYANRTNSGSRGSVMLPSYTDLPPEFRCQACNDLNTLLQRAARDAGCKTVGLYPGEVALMPR
jgi:3',5'-cyclic AMP phosphodiesterase CpdA